MSASTFYLALFCCGGLGVVSRYLVVQLTMKLGLTALPFGTLLVNVSGGFLIGFLSIWMIAKTNWDAGVQLVVLSGFLGGFTTFSAFSLETLKLIESNQAERAALYVVTSVVLSLGFCLLGLLCARRLL